MADNNDDIQWETPQPTPAPTTAGTGDDIQWEQHQPSQQQFKASQAATMPWYQRAAGLLARGVYQGIPAVADIPVALMNGANWVEDKLTGEQSNHIPYPSELVGRGLTKLGLPEPETEPEKFATGAVSAASSLGGNMIVGKQLAQAGVPVISKFGNWLTENPGAQLKVGQAGNAGASAARVAGFGPIGQTMAAIGAGGLAGVRDLSPAMTAKNVENISPDAEINSGVNKVQDVYNAEKARETALWNKAKAAGSTPDWGTNIHGDALIPGVKDQVNSSLFNKMGGVSLDTPGMEPLKSLVGQLDKYKPPVKPSPLPTDPFDPNPTVTTPPPAPYMGAPLADLIAIRKGISRLAGTAQDGNLRHAAGIALNDYDKALEDSAQYAVMSGDVDGVDKFLKAIQQTRSINQRFGTSPTQSGLFQKIITNNDLTNDQVVRAFGTTARGNNDTSQVIKRLLDNAGQAREDVRQNFANGYIYNAIKRSTKMLDSGETVIIPGRLRTELDRLTTAGNSEGGIGDVTRKLVFNSDDLQRIQGLRNSLKDPKISLTGAIMDLAQSKIPMGGSNMPKSVVSGMRRETGKVNAFLNNDTRTALDKLKGKPMSYAGLYGVEEGAQ